MQRSSACVGVIIAAIATSAVSSAQQREIGGVGLTVFADHNFRGKSVTLREQVADFKQLGLNDMISSFRVAPGEQWEFCENANFQGRCVVVSGEERRLRGDWGDVISSARRVAAGVVPPPTTKPSPPTPSDWYIVLFDQRTYRGDPVNYRGPVAILGRFDNRAQSVTIGRGVWELCDGPRFTGRCVTLDRSVADLSAYGLLNRVSSVRPVQPQPR